MLQIVNSSKTAVNFFLLCVRADSSLLGSLCEHYYSETVTTSYFETNRKYHYPFITIDNIVDTEQNYNSAEDKKLILWSKSIEK